MEGVNRYSVRLLPYNESWKEEFLVVTAELEEAWLQNILDIQQVGSTSIQGICAKPILDIAVKLISIPAMDIEALTHLGYDYCGPQHGNQNCHLFVLRGVDQISLRHIHCYDATENKFEQQVGFRDYLNGHPDLAREYNNLKINLALQYPEDRRSYTAGKGAFIQGVLSKMNM